MDACVVRDSPFPLNALVPKAETEALNFILKYPEYNGKDVTIAVLDSGIDPRATGLGETLDGKVKVIHRYDCSGCGDTDVSKKVTATPDGTITGVSGTTLKLSAFMVENNKNANEYHVGLKSLYDLYAPKTREKFAAEMKVKTWDKPHKIATAEVSRQLQAFEAQISGTDLNALSIKDRLKKEDLEATQELLNFMEKRYMDIKITYDCVVFRGEKCWYAVIDTSRKGDLSQGVLIGEYDVTHEVKNIDDFLSVSINVHDDGNVLELVGMCTSHGTHVASIACGNHSEKTLNGVAPNAKVVSLTIGDGRLASMETGTALVRAMIKIMELCNSGTKIDVINMSYGEVAHWSNFGRVGELMNEVVNKYGVVWIVSAGNRGPALCTIGTPPDISQPSCIGVGAYVSPQMMEAEYTMREKLPENVYTWTSRDPCIDGGHGVTVCAPGAAITSVPEYTMSRAQLMNGTSMAAPHVAGAVALLISGLKQRGIKYSPYSIKRAISNTATKLSYVDPFAQGNGLLNVVKAFEHLVQYADQQENSVRFSVKVGSQNAKGIHIRQPGLLKKSTEYNVTIEPVFFNEKETALQDKVNFNVRLTLLCSHPWIQCGSFLDLCYVARNVLVYVDPTGLQPGVHSGVVKAFDVTCVEKGPLFDIPITVVQPHIVQTEKTKTFSPIETITFKPNTIQRDFILVPNNATWAVLKMISSDTEGYKTGKFFVHTMQILPSKYCKAMETMKILPVNNENETVHAFKCEQNNILEVCIAKYWSSFGDTKLKYSVEFHGITANGPSIMHTGNGIYKLDVTALGHEEISPSVVLKTATAFLKPAESKITPLSATRDVVPPGRQIYQNILTYNLHITKSCEITLCAPSLCTMLYENEYESQFWMLFDSNKMMVTSGDAYSGSNNIKLEKGEYVIKLQVRHERKDVLEKISENIMQVAYKLQNSITMDVYEHYNYSLIGGKKLTSCQLSHSVPKSIFIAYLSTERLIKAAIPNHCTMLNGTIVYAKDEIGRKIDVNPFQYILTEGAMKKNNGSPKISKSVADEYKEGLREFNCAMIPKLDSEMAEDVYKQVLTQFPNHLPVHIAFINNFDSVEKVPLFPFAFTNWIKQTDREGQDLPKLTATLRKVIEIANIVIEATPINTLLEFYGVKNDIRQEAHKMKTTIDKQKTTLLEAFVKKGIALCKLKIIEGEKDKEVDTTAGQLEQIDEIYINIGKFVDYADMKVIHFTIWHGHCHQHLGRMAKYLSKLYEEKLSKDVLEEIRNLSAQGKWEHIVDALNKHIVTSNPMGYRPF